MNKNWYGERVTARSDYIVLKQAVIGAVPSDLIAMEVLYVRASCIANCPVFRASHRELSPLTHVHARLRDQLQNWLLKDFAQTIAKLSPYIRFRVSDRR